MLAVEAVESYYYVYVLLVGDDMTARLGYMVLNIWQHRVICVRGVSKWCTREGEVHR